MINKETGEVSSLVRSGKAYNVEMEVLHYDEAVEVMRKFQRSPVSGEQNLQKQVFHRHGFHGKGQRQSP